MFIKNKRRQSLTTHLEVANLEHPKGIAALIADLGSGENGFGGTAVVRGGLTLDEYLHFCDQTNSHRNLMAGDIPRSFFWLLDETGEAVSGSCGCGTLSTIA